MPRDDRSRNWSLLLTALAGAGTWLIVSHWLTPSVSNPEKPEPLSAVSPSATPRLSALAKEPQPAVATVETPNAPARPRELVVKFRSAAELQAFLARVRNLGGRVLAVIPRLGVARIAFDTTEQGSLIRDAVPATATAELNYLVTTPTRPDPQTDAGGPYLGFGREALNWLGVPADNAQWGRGIKVAVLDTGIENVPGLSSIRQIDLIGSGSSSGEMQDHGSSVASIIGGSSVEARGVAPGAELLSIRVLDNRGTGDSFTVAQGMIDAVDNGARVINMSIGSAGDSQVMRDAVNYALSRNVAVVAAVGNEGIGTVSYPAQYPGVIAVTAVDANGQRGGFANFGAGVTLAAPGIGVTTPASANQEGDFSGTSAAAPFVSGTLARLFSENPNLNVAQARQLLTNYSDDAGAPGNDPFFGAGILNVNRLATRNQPGINDAAAADFYYNPQMESTSKDKIPVQVTIQNRGTTTLSSVTVEVENGSQLKRFNVNRLPAGEVRSETIQVDPAAMFSDAGLLLKSRVQINGARDVNVQNDRRTMRLRLKSQ